jgi:hypothetical protein
MEASTIATLILVGIVVIPTVISNQRKIWTTPL